MPLLKLVKVDWIVQVWHGRGWREYPMPVRAVSGANAARLIRPSWGKYRVVRFRLADDPGDKWQKITFKFD